MKKQELQKFSYESPAMKVVSVYRRQRLLCGSQKGDVDTPDDLDEETGW